MWGRRERVRRGGFASQAAARRARDEVLTQSYPKTMGQTWTVARWLRYWLGTRDGIRPGTLRFYTQHVDRYLIPHLGHHKLAALGSRDIAGMFVALHETRSRHGNPIAASTPQRVRATLRAALNAAIREGLITDNPARRVELVNPRRPHAVVWTEPRVQVWRGGRGGPAVGGWGAGPPTPHQPLPFAPPRGG